MKKISKKSLLFLGLGLASIAAVTTAIACSGEQPDPKKGNQTALTKIVDAIQKVTATAKSNYENKTKLTEALTASTVKNDKTKFSALLSTTVPWGEAKLADVKVATANATSAADTAVVTLDLTYGDGDNQVKGTVDLKVKFTATTTVTKTTKELAAEWYTATVKATTASDALKTKLPSSISYRW
ncbi:hypothetical protein [Mycoplasmopsis agassizii]|uniref:Uncharacterized protein n=1 Tax=Mycoplasmopsis agassizii TaxID=33922 RepID=A0ABX4H3Y3_9BACT|nr:hypothetical protein [Mycoplasmopsis agassizii]PAF54596.1 hypothetical protein CJF60_05120 [Mycoplasmopsis agassizii]SMC20663.1 hypothetical protein SAMN02745179_01042 [Mycoplasmopsis agassizii]